jgi:spore maturation protein CgeB
LSDVATARALAEHGRRTILARHTCAHRVDELLAILAQVGPRRRQGAAAV